MKTENSFLISYITLRKSLGFLGLLLPVVLILGSLLFDHCCLLQPSISHYYYTVMGNYFVGTLCAFALFLFSYKGNASIDNIMGNIAGLSALLVAFFPTDCDPSSACEFVFFPTRISVNLIHYIAASVLFGCFAFFSLFLFTKTHKDKKMSKQKVKRNRVYVFCGITIVFSMLMIIVFTIFPCSYDKISTLIFESLALFAFGLSWITKAETIFKDK